MTFVDCWLLVERYKGIALLIQISGSGSSNRLLLGIVPLLFCFHHTKAVQSTFLLSNPNQPIKRNLFSSFNQKVKRFFFGQCKKPVTRRWPCDSRRLHHWDLEVPFMNHLYLNLRFKIMITPGWYVIDYSVVNSRSWIKRQKLRPVWCTTDQEVPPALVEGNPEKESRYFQQRCMVPLWLTHSLCRVSK